MAKRDVSYMKPEKFRHYFTLSEAATECVCDPSWLRRLEADDRIPKAARVKVGKLQVRLWSPEQVDEIKKVLYHNRPGRKPNR